MARLLLDMMRTAPTREIALTGKGASMLRAVLVGLVVFALVSPVFASEQTPEINLAGVYSCEGTNPDGRAYSGIVEIVKIKETYLVRWTMPNDSQVVGVGIFSNGTLSVSYF